MGIRPFGIRAALLIAFSPLQTLGQTTSEVPSRAVPLDPAQSAWVETTLAGMSIDEMAAQLVLMWVPGGYVSAEGEDFKTLAEHVERGIGGLWLMGGLPHDRAALSRALQARASVPLLITTDPMLPNHDAWLLGHATDFPPRVAYGAADDVDLTREGCRMMAAENRAAGSTAYIDGDPGTLLTDRNYVLYARSYGSNPMRVAEHALACIEGYRAAGLSGSVGFFPGVTGAAEDPHVRLPVLSLDRAALDSLDFVTYRRAIEEGVEVVMTSHIAAPALSGDTVPATVSGATIQVLREELGFDGVVATDAFDMEALTNRYDHLDAVVLAFRAGHDLLWAPHPVAAPDTLAALVRRGVIPRSELEASVRRILEMKARLRLHEREPIALDSVSRVVGRREHVAAADRVASRSIVLLRDEADFVPFSDPAETSVLAVTLALPDVTLYGVGRPWLGTALDRTLRRGLERFTSARVSPGTGPEEYQRLLRLASEHDRVVLAVHLAPRLGQDPNTIPFPAAFRDFVDALESDGQTPIVVAFGRHTLLDDLPGLHTFLLGWSSADVMQRAVGRALLGMSPITGRLPFDLPPHHALGEGLPRE